jgi:hypothetical protein
LEPVGFIVVADARLPELVPHFPKIVKATLLL